MQTAKDLLTKTAGLVGGDREKTHGDKVENFDNIAGLWNAYLANMSMELASGLTGSQVADMMELMKIARRQTGTFNPDDYVDGAGYAAVAFECKVAQEDMDKPFQVTMGDSDKVQPLDRGKGKNIPAE